MNKFILFFILLKLQNFITPKLLLPTSFALWNTHLLAKERMRVGRRNNIEDIMPPPFNAHSVNIFVSLSFVREEQLAVLQESWVNGPALEIRITNKINQDAVSWSKLLRSISIFNVDGLAGSFFIDEESCCACRSRQWWTRTEIRYNQRANILGHDKIFQVCEYGRGLNHRKHNKFVFVLPVF